MVQFPKNKSSDSISNNMGENCKEERYFSDDNENWTKLQDIASRRRIQNRISQRKRRRRLRENSISQSGRSNSTSPPPQSTATSTSNQPPQISRTGSDFLEQPLLHSQSRARSISQVSDFSLDGDITPTQNAPLADLSTTPEPNMPSTPRQQAPFTGNWDQQFFDQAFTSEMQSFDNTVDFLYSAGSANVYTGAAQPPSNYSPSLSYSSEGSMGGSLDNMHIDPKLTNDYDDLFNSNMPFSGGNDMVLTSPPVNFAPSPLPTKAFHMNLVNNGYPTPPSSLNSHSSSLQSTPDSLAPNTFTDQSGNTALHLAAEKGHMGIVQLLLDTGIDINASNKDAQTCLHIAVSQNNNSMVGLLLEKGASAEKKNGLGQNSLHLAVEKGNVGLVGLVLDFMVVGMGNGEGADARDCLGQTAFHRAVAMGWEEIVRMMLLRGVNSQSKVGGLGGHGGQEMNM